MNNYEKQQRRSSFLFLIIFALFVLAMCSGCSTTVPVTSKFPEVPERLLVKCPQLQKLEDAAKFSDITKTITVNYTTYYECAVKHDGFVEWYQIQKNIHNNIFSK